MCGRYVTVSSIQAVEQRFNVQAPTPWASNANVSHGDRAPVVASDKPGEVQLMQFGFTPGWAKKQYYMINARTEGDRNAVNDPSYTGAMGILDKPMFRKAIRSQRCLVVADAFIEGPEREKLSKPYVIYPRDGQRPFALAGIWDEWCDPSSGELLRSFAVLTTVSNPLTQAIGHHRAPVILDPDREREWLDPGTPLGDITTMLRTWDAKRFNAYPISPAIRDPRRNGSGLLEPVGQRVWPEFTHEIHSTLEVFGMGESQSRSRHAAEASDTSRGATPSSGLAAEPRPAAWGHQGSLFD